MDYSLENLDAAGNPSVIFRGIVGSRAYGTANANSDTDIRGIFIVPFAEYVRLTPPPKQVSDARNDKTYYSLLRFCELMADANPTTMEMLFLPEDCVLKTTLAFRILAENRRLFVSQRAIDSHIGYAVSQMKKARGTNKPVWKKDKNMMHLMRLLYSGEGIVRNGEPIVRFSGERLERLLSIKRGEWTFDEIMAEASAVQANIEAGRNRLPPECDRQKVDELIAAVMEAAGVA